MEQNALEVGGFLTQLLAREGVLGPSVVRLPPYLHLRHHGNVVHIWKLLNLP